MRYQIAGAAVTLAIICALALFVGQIKPARRAFLSNRAFSGAPPTIPHRVFMRDNCISCHGPTGYHEYRTTHPNRTQCMQCHVEEKR